MGLAVLRLYTYSVRGRQKNSGACLFDGLAFGGLMRVGWRMFVGTEYV
jgi:hypothetical protein